MAAKHTLHVALTEPLVQHVRDQVAVGHYANASEMLREALRLLIERDKTGPKYERLSGSGQASRHG